MKSRLVAHVQSPSSNTTQDYTVSGFGTPDFAIVIAQDFVSATPANTMHNGYASGYVIGFTDGTTSHCAGSVVKDGVNPTNADVGYGRIDTDDVVYYKRLKGDTAATADTPTFITDGLRLTWSTGTDRPGVSVILIQWDAGESAKIGTFTSSGTVDTATTVTTTGVDPNFVWIFGISGTAAADNDADDPCLSVGMAVDNGSSIDQFVHCHYKHNTAQSNVDAAGSIAPDRAGLGFTTSKTKQYELEVTAMGTDDFAVTTRAGSGSVTAQTWMYLAVEFATPAELFMANAPTSTGDWDAATMSFQPESVFVIPTNLAVDDGTDNTGAESKNQSFYYANKNSEEAYFHSYNNEAPSVTTTDARFKYNNRLEWNGNVNGSTPSGNADSGPTFDSSGVIWDVTNAASHAFRTIILGVFETPSGIDPNPGPAHNRHYMHNLVR